jgi:hypothetical protein
MRSQRAAFLPQLVIMSGIVATMRFAACMIALAGCFSPRPGGRCGLARDCAPGLQCVATSSGDVCLSQPPSGEPDAGPDSDAGPDAGPSADAGDASAMRCYATGSLGDVCVSGEPTAALKLVNGQIIDTAVVGACTAILVQDTGAPSLCLMAAGTIEVVSGAIVRVTGPYPLVLLAAHTIMVNGTLDAASHAATQSTPALDGPGIRVAGDCTIVPIDGTSSTDKEGGAGGAAGGSFGTPGGAGGNGGKGATASTPGVTSAPTQLIGGCPGGRGGDGEGNCTAANAPCGGGPGGHGGGAVYLIGGESISVAGAINASGAGGSAGGPGQNSGGSGGGGGSGGMIVLDSAAVTVTGLLFANGGGGGGGNGETRESVPGPGKDPTSAIMAAAGGSRGGASGGQGGPGSVGAAPGSAGTAGAMDVCAGGSGGGGAGVIRIYSAGTPSLTGSISPPPR